MSRALVDPQDSSRSVRAVNDRGPLIQLVSTTGGRDPAFLIYRSARLDDTAFAPHEASSARVYGLAVRIASPTPAEEAVGGPTTEVWRTTTHFDADRSSTIAWIMAIAHRRAVDRLRSVRDTTPPPLVPQRTLGRRARRHAHQARHARRDQATHAEAAQVREALEQLGPDQRDALELVYFDGYSGAPSLDLATIMTTIVTTRLAEVPAEQQGHEQKSTLDCEAS